jgi:hypothetical protein
MIVVYLVLGIVLGIIGSTIAKSNGRDPAVWFVICAFVPLIGIVALLIAGESKPHATAPVLNFKPIEPEARNVQARMEAPQSEKYDRKRWSVLKEVDPEIAAASKEVVALASHYDDVLAEKYLVLGDKTYLSALVNGIKAEHDKREKELENALASETSEKAMAVRSRMAEREKRSLAMMAEIEASNMYCKYSRKRVRSMEIYRGLALPDHGFVKLAYEDGTYELRSGDSYFSISAEYK